jgi:hypothetical protein
LDRPGLRCISFENFEKPFYVYFRDGARYDALNNNVGKFRMPFIEPEPVYPFFDVNVNAGQEVTISLLTANGRNVRVYWGDGEYTNFNGTVLTALSHSYSFPGVYKISILENIDDLYSIQITNQPIEGNLTNITNNIPTGNIQNIRFADCNLTFFSGGKIPQSLLLLDVSGNNFSSSLEIDRVLQSLVNDGTCKINSRSSQLHVLLSGAGMPVCTDWNSYDTVFPAIAEISVNGIHP